MFGLEAPCESFGKGGKEVAEGGVDFAVGADVGANGGSDGVLIDANQFIELGKAGEGGAINGDCV